MSMVIGRTVTASELRDPEVLAEAGRTPIGVYDSRRQETLVLTSRAAFETDQRLHDYMGLLAHAVVELSRDDPSPAALGEAGYVTSWLPADRIWWLRGLAEAVAASVAEGSVEPVAGFVRLARSADFSMESRLERPIESGRFTASTRAKLKLHGE
jgi:hypothetical protein